MRRIKKSARVQSACAISDHLPKVMMGVSNASTSFKRPKMCTAEDRHLRQGGSTGLWPFLLAIVTFACVNNARQSLADY